MKQRILLALLATLLFSMLMSIAVYYPKTALEHRISPKVFAGEVGDVDVKGCKKG